MARKKTKVLETSNEGLNRMQLVAAYAAACSSEKLRAAFAEFACGEELFSVFVSAVNAEVEHLFRGDEGEAEVEELTDRVVGLSEAIDVLESQVKGLTNERLFAVLNVVTRNFGGTPVPPPPPVQQPAAQQPAPSASSEAPASPKKNLKKRYAATDVKDVQPAAQAPETAPTPPPQESASRPAAPTMPPRGNRIVGMF